MASFQSVWDMWTRGGRSLRCAGYSVRAPGLGGVLALSLACGSGLGQTVGAAALPEGPAPQAGVLVAEADRRWIGGDAPQSSSQDSQARQDGGVPQDGQTSQASGRVQPSPIAPSRLNPGSAAAPGPLTQAERNQYVVRQLIAPEHIFGYSASALYHMANPPGRGSTYYPKEWRVGGPGFGRNFGDSAAQDETKHVGKYVSGALLREDPRYYPSASTSLVRRAEYAVLFTLVDRSNDGERRPAFSNLVGAAAGAYVGDAYLPPGFRNQAHATQRALLNLAGFAGENGLAEFKPEIREGLRRLHVPFVH